MIRICANDEFATPSSRIITQAYGVQCLPYWVKGPSGHDFKADLVYFNWGLHNTGNGQIFPGQIGLLSAYESELRNITAQLKNYSRVTGAKLLYGLTTAYMCSAQSDKVIRETLNVQAAAVMKEARIPTVDLHGAIVAKCGPSPNNHCPGLPAGCWCPHCQGPGYAWLANSTIVPAIRKLLTRSSSTSAGTSASVL